MSLPSGSSSSKQSVDPKARLRAYLDSLPTPTAARAALSSLVRGVLLHTAARLRCTHLALGTPLTSLSISLLSSVSHGAGAHVPEAFSEEWTPPSCISRNAEDGKDEVEKTPIRIVRPLQDIGAKECAAYARWRQLPLVHRPSWPGLGGKSTIGGLTTGIGVFFDAYDNNHSVLTCNFMSRLHCRS